MYCRCDCVLNVVRCQVVLSYVGSAIVFNKVKAASCKMVYKPVSLKHDGTCRWSNCMEQFASGHPNCTDNIYIQESP